MKRKKWLLIVPILLAAFMISGCAGIKEKYEKATPDEKARILLSQAQKSLNTLFAAGETAVAANPSLKDEWKKIIPAIKAANAIVGDLIKKGEAGIALDPTEVLAAIGGRIKEITDALAALGVKISMAGPLVVLVLPT